MAKLILNKKNNDNITNKENWRALLFKGYENWITLNSHN